MGRKKKLKDENTGQKEHIFLREYSIQKMDKRQNPSTDGSLVLEWRRRAPHSACSFEKRRERVQYLVSPCVKCCWPSRVKKTCKHHQILTTIRSRRVLGSCTSSSENRPPHPTYLPGKDVTASSNNIKLYRHDPFLRRFFLYHFPRIK